MVDCLINTHYTHGPSMAFHEQVLAHLSFSTKLAIVERFLGPEDSAMVRMLFRLNTVRNLFAHCGVLRQDTSSEAPSVVNPRKPGEKLDFEKLYAEFAAELPGLETFLIARACNKGARIFINLGDRWKSMCDEDEDAA